MSERKRPKVAPLPDSFFLMSIIGLFVSVIYVIPRSQDFGVAFTIVFGAMFIASMVSLTYAPARALIRLEEYEMNHKKGVRILSHKEFWERKKKKKAKKVFN